MIKPVLIHLVNYVMNSRNELEGGVSFRRTRKDVDANNPSTPVASTYGGTEYQRFHCWVENEVDGTPKKIMPDKNEIGLVSLNSNVVTQITGGDPFLLVDRIIAVNPEDFLNSLDANLNSPRRGEFKTYMLVFTQFSVADETDAIKASRKERFLNLDALKFKARQDEQQDWRNRVVKRVKMGQGRDLPTQNPAPTLQDLMSPNIITVDDIARSIPANQPSIEPATISGGGTDEEGGAGAGAGGTE